MSWTPLVLQTSGSKGPYYPQCYTLRIILIFFRNVHNRNKAITAFKADDLRVRVIMLGLESAASGTNLMEATHVVLLGKILLVLEYNIVTL
jgi:hypothetical protein